MLQVCPLKQSHSDLPGIISPLALKEAFDIWSDPFFFSDILGLLKFYLFSAISSEEWQEEEIAKRRGKGEAGLCMLFV